MSLRNRARALQKKTGLSYQQAQSRLRALGERPARLSRETGWPLEVCDRFLVDGHAPIEVLEVVHSDRDRRIEEICETLRTSANARAVVLAQEGRPLTRAGVAPGPRALLLALVSLRPRDLRELVQHETGETIYSTPVARATLVILFHTDETSIGLVKLRARRAAEDLAPLLSDPDPPMPPPSGRGGPTGIPHELRVVAPVAEPRPKPKRTPIGRKRKRPR